MPGRSSKRCIELSCTHVMCYGCATKMAGAGMRKCPICRHPHLLDPKLLAERKDAWRSAYGGWRQGNKRGAVGEISSIQTVSVAEVYAQYRITGGSDLVRALDLATSGESWGRLKVPQGSRTQKRLDLTKGTEALSPTSCLLNTFSGVSLRPTSSTARIRKAAHHTDQVGTSSTHTMTELDAPAHL